MGPDKNGIKTTITYKIEDGVRYKVTEKRRVVTLEHKISKAAIERMNTWERFGDAAGDVEKNKSLTYTSYEDIWMEVRVFLDLASSTCLQGRTPPRLPYPEPRACATDRRAWLTLPSPMCGFSLRAAGGAGPGVEEGGRAGEDAEQSAQLGEGPEAQIQRRRRRRGGRGCGRGGGEEPEQIPGAAHARGGRQRGSKPHVSCSPGARA